MAALAGALVDHADSVSIDVLRGVESAAAQFADRRFRETATDAWQADARAELSAHIGGRLPLWAGELPPDLRGGSAA